MNDFDVNQVRTELLPAAIKEAGSIRGFATQRNLSASYVSLVLSGKRTVGPKVLQALGLKSVVVYRRID